jgi:hypothetical protein
LEAEGAPDRPDGQCPTCRGRGWLNVRSRPVYRSVALKITGAPLPRETCWDCGGKGFVA